MTNMFIKHDKLSDDAKIVHVSSERHRESKGIKYNMGYKTLLNDGSEYVDSKLCQIMNAQSLSQG